jgi:hypothetical protein
MLLLRETPKAVPKLDGHVDCLVAGTGLKAAIKIQSIEKVGVTAIFRGLIPPDWIALFRVQPEAKRKRGAMLPRILIVDANARMRRTIRRVVEDRTDLQVCGEGTDGQDAIRRAEQLKPDLVILDLTMPKMNGLQVARAIKKLLPQGAPGFVQPGRTSTCAQCGKSCWDNCRSLEARGQSKSVPRLANGAAVGGMMGVLFS